MASIIREFSPALSSIKSPQSKCKIIINNYNSGTREVKVEDGKLETVQHVEETEPEQVKQPRLSTFDPNAPSDLSTFATRRGYNDEVTQNAEELYKHLALAFSKILKTNNIKLVSNLIDMSGKILLDIEDLVQAIALVCNTSLYDIRVEYEDPEVGCLGKVSPIKQIVGIKVGNYDFTTRYNKQANMLRDTFSVSLQKVLVNSLI